MQQRRWAVPVACAALVVLCAALASRAHLGTIVEVGGDSFSSFDSLLRTSDTAAEPLVPPSAADVPVPEEAGAGAFVVQAAIAVLLTVAGLGLGAVVTIALVRALRHPVAGRREAEPDEDAPAAVSTAQVHAAASAATATLASTDSDHDAIVGAWLDVEDAVGAAGRPRLAHETSTEFVLASTRHLNVDHASLARLGELYRQAYHRSAGALEAADLAAMREEATALTAALLASAAHDEAVAHDEAAARPAGVGAKERDASDDAPTRPAGAER